MRRPPPQADIQLGFRGVGEIWQDEGIVTAYRSSRFSGSAFGRMPVWGPFLGEVEVGYFRTASDDAPGVLPGAFELVPLDFVALVQSHGDRAVAFAGGGVAMTVFNETWASDPDGMTETRTGAKVGMDLRVGVRIATDLVQQSIRPGSSSSVKGVDVELLLGRRQHQMFHVGEGEGLDLSAWRVGVGLVARL